MYQQTKFTPYQAAAPVMMVPSATMFGMPPYAPVNVYTAPPVAAVPPVTVLPSSLPNAEVELKQVNIPNLQSSVAGNLIISSKNN